MQYIYDAPPYPYPILDTYPKILKFKFMMTLGYTLAPDTRTKVHVP